MNHLLDIVNLLLLLSILIPLGIFLWWNWQYRNLGNGFRVMRLTIQHWTSGLFFLILYLTIRRLAVMFGWDYPAIINQWISTALFIYLIFRTWSSMLTFKRIRREGIAKHIENG